MPPPPLPTTPRPAPRGIAPPPAPLPPRQLPPNPPREAGAPQTYFHPSYFYELRDNKLTHGAKSFSLLWPQLKKVMQDPALHSVTFSKKFGPGGRNAFLSYAPHFWPNPDQLDAYLKTHPGATSDEWEDKIVWDRTDAKRNADTGNASQAKELQAVCQKVFVLAIAYFFGLKWNPSVCAPASKKAYELLWTFFGDPNTRMIPEVEYGQYVRGCQPKGPYRPEGFLHIRGLILISQVLPLLPAPPSPFSPHSFMHPWFEQHVNFLQHHECGRLAATRKNNIQTHYLIQLATHLVTINRPLDAHNIATGQFFPSPGHPNGISAKISEQTSALVEEIKRPNPVHYTLFELEPLTYLASLATAVRQYNNLGHLPDVWEAESHALKRAIDFGIFYLLKSVGSEEPQGMRLPDGVKEPEKGNDVRQMVFIARAAAVRYGGGEYQWLVGTGANGDMEPRSKEEAAGWKAPSSTLEGFNLNGRWIKALLEGY